MRYKVTQRFSSGDKNAPFAGTSPGLAEEKKSSGVALLIVLGMLVLLAVIVVAFLTSVTTDLADSKSYEAQTTTRMLADSALNLVIGEIRQASTTGSAAWISQPGLIRTFDNQGNTVAYKLYSASQMVVSGSFDPNAGTDLPSGNTWLNQPNLYTDINSPIISGTGIVFPIIDGNGIRTTTVGGTTVLTYSADGVIPDVEGFATNPTQVGITFSGSAALSATNSPVPMPVQWLYMLKDGTLIPATAAGSGKDVTFSGTVTPSGTNPIVARVAFWTDDESSKVNVNTASEGIFWDTPVAVTQPPISDASEPDPQGNPAYIFDPNQMFEWDLAQRQADQREYQRYPGHPATTCLSPILGSAVMKGLSLPTSTSLTGYSSNYGYHTLTGANWAKFAEFFNQLAPRVSGYDSSGTLGANYSSQAGTIRPGGTSTTNVQSGTSLYLTGNTNAAWGQAITPDADRLYANVDEYFYAPTLVSGTARQNNGFAESGATQVLTPAVLERSKFFLTANSKSPEQNLFNMPRVSVWPITKTASTLDNPDTSNANVQATMTAFDKILAFCATVSGTSNALANKVPFYFSRYDPFSSTADYSNSTNNQNLYTYLHNMMGMPFPGFGNGTFVQKYPNEDTGGDNQILTEIYDYIRCTNLADCSEDVVGSGNYGAKSYTMVNPTAQFTDAAWESQTSQGQVVPIVIGSTRGFGRVATIGEMTLVMLKENETINNVGEGNTTTSIGVGSGQYTGTWNLVNPVQGNANVLPGETVPGTVYVQPTPTTPPSSDTLLLPGAGGLPNKYDPRKQTKVQFALMPYYFSPMAGFSALANNIRLHWSNVNISVTGMDGVTTTAVAPGPGGSPFPNGTQGQDLYDSGRIELINQGESKIGGPIGPKSMIDPLTDGGTPTNLGAPKDSMPQVLEAVVGGTSAPGGFSSSGSNTMQISGSATLQIMVPAVPVTWAARGINDQPTVIQTINFTWPQTKVQIPTLGGASDAFAAIQSSTLPSGQSGASTLSSNPATAESVVISATSSGGVSVKGSNTRLVANGNNYDTVIISNGPNDIYRSLMLSGSTTSGVPIQGDFRLPAAMAVVPSSYYQPYPKYPSGALSGSATPYFDQTQQYAYGWKAVTGMHWPNTIPYGYLIENQSARPPNYPQYGGGVTNNTSAPYVPIGVSGVYNANGINSTGVGIPGNEGDYDNGPGWVEDGAFVNKADEGWVRHLETGHDFVSSSVAGYIGHPYCQEDAALGAPSLYAPNKMISSPVMFGSLPTGVLAGNPWQTLLFRPAKSYLPGGDNHPGAAKPAPTDGSMPAPPYTTPPDHLLLDLFWMPVVDPYPISEPFATAGKVNLNYQIAPFTYITRKTALRAVMQSVKITAINPTENGQGGQLSANDKSPGSWGNNSSGGAGGNGGVGVSLRRTIDLDSTLKQIDQFRFGVNQPFISASEICDIPLIPADLPNIASTNTVPYNINSQIQAASPSGYDAILKNFWYGDPTNTGNQPPPAIPQFGHRGTGDNSLERPYSMIYPRLTTKSNTYTVHVRVQTLKKSTTTPVTVFKDGQDQVVGEFRGSFVIERYLDPATAGFYANGNINNPLTMAQAIAPNSGAQLGPYKFRIISSKQFGQ